MRITLKVTSGPHQGREFSFDSHDTFLVGRSKRAHFRLPVKDGYFSRIHFLVEVNPPLCRLTDMGSTNGTYVNNLRVETWDLKNGDRIQAGRTVLRVLVEADDTVASAGQEATAVPGTSARLPAAVPAPTVAATIVTPVPLLSPGRTTCLVCPAPLPVLLPGRAGSVEPAPLLCGDCQEQARQQAQPIAGYLIVKELGRGGMGVVALALRLATGTPVALKTIVPKVAVRDTDILRFLREAEIISALQHPNIVAFLEKGESNGQLYFAMEYVPGSDAGRLLAGHGPLPVARAARWTCQLLRALEYAHAGGKVHRDIKPANLLVGGTGPDEVVKLADFGLARVYQQSKLSGMTMSGELGGTMAFIPPEQITNYRDVKPAADQYSVGATLYTLLTNRSVYNLPSEFHKQVLQVLQEAPIPIQQRRADLSDSLAAIVHRALARQPEDRFADARAMRRALTPYCT